ncbi:MAG TPA: hypothetical protein EYQ71_06965 [Candidatus Thioglobus sp.]|nr:hypothetical protein [Candidatus Thioglobus sp.]
MQKILKKFALIALIFLTGCSSTTFVYNRIDYLLPWYFASYVDLSRDQKNYLDELLIPFFSWHRHEELPRYAEIINSVEGLLDSEVKVENIALITLDVEESWFRLEDGLLLRIIPLAKDLTDEQINNFLQVMQTKTIESENKYLKRNDQAYQKDNYNRLRKNLRRFIGTMSKEQLDLVKIASNNMRRTDTEWIQNRKKLVANLSSILQRKEGWEKRFIVITHRDDLVSKNYRDTYAYNIDLTHNLIAAILNTRTEKQDKKLRAQLSKYQADIETLINHE